MKGNLLFLFFLITIVYAAPRFSEVYNGGGFVCVDSGYAPGERLTILNLNTGKMSTAVVVKDTSYQDLEFETIFPTMIIKSNIKEKITDNRFLAISGKVTGFSLVPLKYEKKEFKTIAIPDTLVKNALNRDVGCRLYYKFGLDSNYAKVAQIDGKKMIQLWINGLESGPQFIKLKSRYEILHSPCSIEQHRAFRLNGFLYIYSGSGGCECGSYGLELHIIKESGIKEVYRTWKWSM